MEYGKYTADHLRLLIDLLPVLEEESAKTKQVIQENPEKLFSQGALYTWHEFYELPFSEHLSRCIAGLGLSGNVAAICSAPNHIEAIAADISAPDSSLDEELASIVKGSGTEPGKGLHYAYALVTSVHNSFRSLMVYGCYLNDLIAQARSGDVLALFNAIRIDPTIVGSKTASTYITAAQTVGDVTFLAKLKAALNGKFEKRNQANFQKMRVVLRVLAEAGAGRLTDEQLHELFVKELNLYTSNTRSKDMTRALRKFADQYMKKNAIT